MTEQIDEAAHALGQTLLPLHITRVTEPRRFRLDMNGRRLGRLFIGFNQFATDTEVDTQAVEDTVGIAIGYDREHPSHFEVDGQRVPASTSTAVVLSPSRHVHIYRPGHSGVFALTISVFDLAKRYEEITGSPVRSPIKFEPSVDLTKSPGRMLHELTKTLAATIERNGDGSENMLFCSTLEDAMVSVLLGLAHHQGRRLANETQHGVAPWMVRRAEDYMAAHAADPITLSDLVAVCGCSRSALFTAFRSSRGHSPMQFLASRRLELARERLMRDPAAAATRIALDCGFGNYGRFAKAYRARFGESPATTLARCHAPTRR